MLVNNRFLEILIVSFLLVASGCASLPDNNSRQASCAFNDTDDTTFGQLAAKRIQTEGQVQDGFLLIKNGLEPLGYDCCQLYFSERRLAVVDERLKRVIRPG